MVYRAHHNARILCVMEHPTLKVRLNASLLLDVQCKHHHFLHTIPQSQSIHPSWRSLQLPTDMNPLEQMQNRSPLPPKSSSSSTENKTQIVTLFPPFVQTRHHLPFPGRPASAIRCVKASRYRSSVTWTRIRRAHPSGRRTTAIHRYVFNCCHPNHYNQGVTPRNEMPLLEF